MDVHENLADFIQSLPNPHELSWRALILLVAYHLRRGGRPEFSRADLLKGFDSADLPVPDKIPKRIRALCESKNAPVLRHGGKLLSLSLYGVREIEDYLRSISGFGAAEALLDRIAEHISDDSRRRYMPEASECVRRRLKRAAVVMVWIVALDHMQRYVLAHALGDFNLALTARGDYRGLQIQRVEDFAELRDEKTFVELLRAAKIVTNNLRKILEQSLDFRNTCAHPSEVQISDNRVIVFIEDLVDNVILRHKL